MSKCDNWLISFVLLQIVTGTILYTIWANWWQTVVTYWFNWRNKASISLKITCSKRLFLKILFCKATFHCCYQYIYWRESLKMVHHWWWYVPSCYTLYILVDIHFDFCAPSYCSISRKFYETHLEVFKSLHWIISILW